MKIQMERYTCKEGHEFFVHDGSEPVCCPFCGSKEWEQSGELSGIYLMAKDEEPDTMIIVFQYNRGNGTIRKEMKFAADTPVEEINHQFVDWVWETIKEDVKWYEIDPEESQEE